MLSKHLTPTPGFLGFPCGSAGKESACNAGDLGLIPGLGRSPVEGKGYPLQYSGLENSMDCIVHGVAESYTTEWLSLSLQAFNKYIFWASLKIQISITNTRLSTSILNCSMNFKLQTETIDQWKSRMCYSFISIKLYSYSSVFHKKMTSPF